MSDTEVAAVLGRLERAKRLVATLLHGCGLRFLEVLNLRVNDLDFGRCTLTVGGGRTGLTGATQIFEVCLHFARRTFA